MTNDEQQANEIIALQSIFDKEFRLLDVNHYEILIDFDLPAAITLRYSEQTASIQHLPPFTLIVHYHDEYPSQHPPSFLLFCVYFSSSQLRHLCHQLDHHPFQPGEVCVYEWIELIRMQIGDQLALNSRPRDQEYEQEEVNDPRALHGYVEENAEKIFHYLVSYNRERESEQFNNQLQTCLICADTLRGTDCVRLHRCGHFFCRSCLDSYVRATFEKGRFGERIHCPENECRQAILPTEVKQIVADDGLYERYERLTLQHGLESMSDILWCPRCQCAVLPGAGDDNLAMCEQCYYTFCKKCKEIFHSQTMCPRDYMIQQLKLRKEKELQRLQQQQEQALAARAQVEEEKKLASERKTRKATPYREIRIDQSDEEALLEELLNAEGINSLNTQHCPSCRVRIEKNGGCSHMHCSRCGHHFTWQSVGESATASTNASLKDYIQSDQPIEAIKKELNKLTVKVTKPTEEAAPTNNEVVTTEKEADSAIKINNRSAFGSAIINRVKRCPAGFCRRLNAKIGEDNWIICNGCMKQYCFSCLHAIFGPRHFEKKCQRYTPV